MGMLPFTIMPRAMFIGLWENLVYSTQKQAYCPRQYHLLGITVFRGMGQLEFVHE